MMPVDLNGLDFARPPDSGLMMVGEENAAAPHFPPLPNLIHQRSPSEVEVDIYKIWILTRKRIYIFK